MFLTLEQSAKCCGIASITGINFIRVGRFAKPQLLEMKQELNQKKIRPCCHRVLDLHIFNAVLKFQEYFTRDAQI